MEPHIPTDFKESFSCYLTQAEWSWTWFVTQTFDSKKVFPHPDIVKRSWKDFMRECARDSPINYGWVFAEIGRFGRIHWHALVRVEPDLFGHPSQKEIFEYMYDKYGRITISSYQPGQKVVSFTRVHKIADGISRYLTKYLVKGSQELDLTWDFQGFLSGSEADSKRICHAIGLPLASEAGIVPTIDRKGD